MARASRMTTFRSFATATRLAVRPGGPSLAQRLAAVPRMVRASVSGAYPGLPSSRLVMVLGAAAYLFLPFDLAPELVLGPLGLLDDAMVIGWLVKELVQETEDFIAWERHAGTSASASGRASHGHTGPTASSAAGETIQGRVVR